MRVRWNEIPRARWDRFAAAGGAAMQQDWAYGEAMAALGAGVARACVEADGVPVALAQILTRRFGPLGWSLCSRGPVWLADLGPDDKAAALRALRIGAPGPRWGVALFTPEAPEGDPAPEAAGLRRVTTGAVLAELDLRGPDEALRGAMKQKWRNRLNAALRKGADVRILERDPRGWRWLLAQEAAQRRERRYRALPTAFCDHWSAATPKGRGVAAFEARREGVREAAMLFLRHGRRATYQIGWCGAAGRASGAHCLLLWEAMRRFRAEGVERIDLGGLDTETGAGLARFKLGSGARAVTLCGTYV